MKKLLAVLFILTTFLSSAQSPWVAGKNKGYIQLGFTTIGPYDKLFLSNGDNDYVLNRKVSDRTLQLYSEYGVGDKTSLLAVVPFKMLATGEAVSNPSISNPSTPIEEGSFSTLGNIQLAVRQNFVNKNYVLSGQLALELPTAGFDEKTGLRGGLDAFSIVPTISIGKGLASWYGFVAAGVGIRTNEYSSDFRIGGEIGYQIIKRVYLVAVLDVVENFENGDAEMDEQQLQAGLYLNNQSFFAYGFKGIIGFSEKFGINAAFYGAGGGNAVAKAPSINFGVYYKW
jgi:hypothetical protein